LTSGLEITLLAECPLEWGKIRTAAFKQDRYYLYGRLTYEHDLSIRFSADRIPKLKLKIASFARKAT